MISVGPGGVAGVAGAAVGVAGGAAIGVAGSAAIRVAGGGGGVVSLSKVELSWSYRATVIIGLILLRARPISSSVYS